MSQIGRLRDKVWIQARDPAALPNAFNEVPDLWIDVLADIWAAVVALSGREYIAAQQTQTALTHTVEIRRPSVVLVTPAHRVKWIEYLPGGSTVTHCLDIKHVVPLVRDRGRIQLQCVEHG